MQESGVCDQLYIKTISVWVFLGGSVGLSIQLVILAKVMISWVQR